MNEQPIRVMVVDDHPMWRDAVERDLVASGLDVVAVAASGDEAVTRFAASKPQVVVLDLQIPAHQSSTAQVPVHAVGSGDVVVEVLLTTPEGSPIDDPVEIQVRVRADWETVGTAVVAGILVVMLVVGIIRTVRRARRRGQPEEATT